MKRTIVWLEIELDSITFFRSCGISSLYVDACCFHFQLLGIVFTNICDAFCSCGNISDIFPVCCHVCGYLSSILSCRSNPSSSCCWCWLVKPPRLLLFLWEFIRPQPRLFLLLYINLYFPYRQTRFLQSPCYMIEKGRGWWAKQRWRPNDQGKKGCWKH